MWTNLIVICHTISLLLYFHALPLKKPTERELLGVNGFLLPMLCCAKVV